MLKRTATVPEARMLSLVNFDQSSVALLREHLGDLTSVDQTGIQRLEVNGVLDLWNVHLELKRAEK